MITPIRNLNITGSVLRVHCPYGGNHCVWDIYTPLDYYLVLSVTTVRPLCAEHTAFERSVVDNSIGNSEQASEGLHSKFTPIDLCAACLNAVYSVHGGRTVVTVGVG